uniref:TRF2/HOY1 PH-like domain-containing protein n=1 Tax=Kalanchoe fedtschenkoi TaxID=63787 RepID=A0A7N0UER2_KALFE
MDDIYDVPLVLPFTIDNSFDELLMTTLYTLPTKPGGEILSGMPGQGIHGHRSPAASGANPDSILAHQEVGSNQAFRNANLGRDQFMGCHPRFHTGGLSASNPSLVLADQCRIPAESELGKGYDGGAGIGRESQTPEDRQADTKPIKRRVGRPKGSSSKNPARELKGPAALQLTLQEIRIGPWKKTNETGCDLLAKCYFGHRKLIWEVLCHETKLKSRMEVDWKHILSMKTSSLPDELIMLQLELSQRPGFSHETKVISNKHSSWGACGDFTSGYASSYSMTQLHVTYFSSRIHDLVFKTRVFCDKMLEKSQELRELSQKQFPTLGSTRFEASNSGAPAMQMIDPPAPSGLYSFQPIAQPFVNVEGIFYQSSSDDRLPSQAPHNAAAAPTQNNLPGC